MVLIEILLKKSTSDLFLKLVASVLPRRAFTCHRVIVVIYSDRYGAIIPE